MAMKPEVKTQLLSSAEKLTEVALEEVLKLAKVYAASSESPIDDTIVSGVESLKKAFLDDLVDKIDEDDEN